MPNSTAPQAMVITLPYDANAARTVVDNVRIVARAMASAFPEVNATVIPVGEHDTDVCWQAVKSEVRSSRLNVWPFLKESGADRGKGESIRIGMRVARGWGAAFVMMDADLIGHDTGAGIAGMSEDWVAALVEPVVTGVADMVVPTFLRHHQESRVTNPAVYPLVSGLLGVELRQPIGGNYALSPAAVRTLLGDLQADWSPSLQGYGIDIWLLLQAIKQGYELGVVDLGVKLQTMDVVMGVDGLERDAAMFRTVAETLLESLWRLAMQTGNDVLNLAPPSMRRLQDPSLSTYLPEAPWDRQEIVAMDEVFRGAVSRCGEAYFRHLLGAGIWSRLAPPGETSGGSGPVPAGMWAEVLVQIARSYGEMRSEGRSVDRLMDAFTGLFYRYLAAYQSWIIDQKVSGATDCELCEDALEREMGHIAEGVSNRSGAKSGGPSIRRAGIK